MVDGLLDRPLGSDPEHQESFASEAAYSGVTMATIAQRNFTLARENDIVFDVVQRMSRHHAAMAVVMKTGGRGRPSEVVGIISKEHIADSVADSIRPFG